MKATIAGSALLALPIIVAGKPRETDCCEALARHPRLQGKIYSRDTDAFNARLASYYSANSALAPTCMAMPECTEEVAAIARIISETNCPFGMRSGAHSAWKGANSVDTGVTIDFTYMNKTAYDTNTKISSVQPGSTWGDTFKALDPYGVTNVGGRASVVGVGGFTTGGGYSFHSNTHGFSCDSVVNFEVVLAGGSIVNANAKENQDLWRALKGGSGNFGFVTRVDQRVVESNRLWGGFVLFDIKDSDAVFDAYHDFVEEMDTDPASQLVTAVHFNGTHRLITSVLSNVDAIERPPIFDKYLAVERTSDTLSTAGIADFVVQFTAATPLHLYANWMTGETTNDVRVMRFAERKHAETVEKMKAAAPGAEFNLHLQFQPVTPRMAAIGAASGGNSLGLEAITNDGPSMMWMIMCTVDTAENQEKIHPLTLEFRQSVIEYASKIGAHQDWQYLNYALGDQDPLRHYGPEAVRFLDKTAKRYDPNGVFQKLRASGFKLPV